jgi:hypothetical protein
MAPSVVAPMAVAPKRPAAKAATLNPFILLI